MQSPFQTRAKCCYTTDESESQSKSTPNVGTNQRKTKALKKFRIDDLPPKRRDVFSSKFRSYVTADKRGGGGGGAIIIINSAQVMKDEKD